MIGTIHNKHLAACTNVLWYPHTEWWQRKWGVKTAGNYGKLKIKKMKTCNRDGTSSMLTSNVILWTWYRILCSSTEKIKGLKNSASES